MEKRKKLFFGGVGAKAIAIFASVSLCVGLIGCGKEPVETVDPNAEQSTAQQSEQVVEKIEGEDAPLGSIDVEGPNQTQEESGEVVQEIVPLFEGAVGEAYETDSVDWLVNGNDDDVITLVYTCVDNTHGGWGVVGTGATVDGAWVEGPSFKADEKNPLALLYTSFTVKQLKSMLGVEEDSVVSFFKVSSWNGGQIVALYVTSAGEVLELNNATEVELEGTASGEEEEEVAAFEFEGNYDRFLTTVSNLEIKIADYISGYVPGTPIIVEMKMESDGLFNGCLGTCIGSDYAWTTKEFASDTGSEVTLSWELVPSIDNIQLQLWAMEGSKVGVRSIKMSQTTISENTIVGNTDSNKPSMNGSYLAKYTSGGDVSYNISLLSSGWTMGDTVRVTVVYECDGGTNGAFGTCVGSNYAWTTSNWSTDNYGTYTASFEVTPSIDNVQFQIYYVGGSAIGIKSVSVAVTASPYSGIAIMSTGSKHVASIASLCPGVEDGDTVRLSATLYSGDYFNGCIGGSNSNEAWINTSGECSNGESTWSVTISNVDADAAAEVQVWWSNSGKVALKSLTGTIVAKGEKTEEGEDGEEGEEGEGGEEGGEEGGNGTPGGSVGGGNAGGDNKDNNTGDDAQTPDYAAIAALSGTEYLTEDQSCDPWGQALTVFTTNWGGSLNLSTLTANNYWVVTYTSDNAPQLILQEPWTTINAAYVANGVAVFSYADMVAAYEDLSAAGALNVGAQGSELTITSVKLVDVTAVEGDDNTGEEVQTPDYAAIAVLSGTEYLAEEQTCDPWGQALTVFTTNWGGSLNLSTLTANNYWVVTYTSDNAPQLILQEPWTTINAAYVANGVAVFSYADMVAAYEDLSAAGALNVGAQGSELTITSVKLVDASTGTEDGDNTGDEPQLAPNQVVLADSLWWTELELTRAQVLGDVDPATVESITISGETSFKFGYNGAEGYTEVEDETSYTLTDIVLDDYFFAKIGISKGDGVGYVFTWTLNLKDITEGDDETEEGDDETEEGDDETEEGNDETLEGDDETEEGDDETEEGDDETLEGDDETEEGNDETLEGDDETEEGDDETEEGDDETLEGDDETEEGDDETEEGDDETEEGDDETEEGDDETPEGDDETPEDALVPENKDEESEEDGEGEDDEIVEDGEDEDGEDEDDEIVEDGTDDEDIPQE